ncbi:putative acyl esterase [Solirubrobacter pauli]|uniref:Putative acyl esterase n=1 Tax=Solirubrobacter pauli TaxID=166793 RepID=A0A660LDH5_9ACTN|nr:CocE/NonD family hydrolase C-terminal non-catalytic domain-containing protein [Solirubrobacter pauli]RKQ92316.1 putative acyl esterase [Solirubrobacter pauli]
MRRMLTAAACAAPALVIPSAADAAIPRVFTKTAAPIDCTVQANGQRFCGTATAQVPSWDGTPIDVAVGFPAAPAGGPDGPYPVIGIFHGWGGTKVALSGGDAQRALTRGYAVFTMTDRGWGGSCGRAMISDPRCAGKGYIRLMHSAYEVRDAQHLLGQLADDGLIEPQRIGATGGSYGGGMAIALGALRNRTRLPDGSSIPWTSPLGKPMAIAATVPEFTWSDLATALNPNGSSLDYVADAPYLGGGHRVGVQKQAWNASLYGAGALLGYYAPIGTDPSADITGWKTLTDTGGPFDGVPAADAMAVELPANHSAYGIDDSIPPAPALLANGWNDDLFPVDESLRYYNRVRAKHPGAPISMFHLDFGHSPRAASGSAADRAALATAENAWLDFYVKGVGAEPADARGGVDVLTSHCPVSGAGTRYHAPTWAQLAPGELRVTGAAAQTIVAPGTAPSNGFTAGDVCTTTASADNASAATYKTAPATTAYTLAGSPTVIAKLDVKGANDMVAARLYDVDGATQRLIARGVQRPLNPGGGPTEQVFQLHPQAWTVQPGHVLKLELLAQDSPYLRTPTGQQSVAVSDLELRLPLVDAPGTDLGGLVVAAPKPKYLPAGYTPAREYATQAGGTVGGTVPATLALSLGAPATFGAFVPGVDREYAVPTTLTVTSSAGDAALTTSDPGHLVNGAFSLPQPLRVELSRSSWAGPTANERVDVTFRQAIGRTDALRTGTYSTRVTFTLSTTNP